MIISLFEPLDEYVKFPFPASMLAVEAISCLQEIKEMMAISRRKLKCFILRTLSVDSYRFRGANTITSLLSGVRFFRMADNLAFDVSESLPLEIAALPILIKSSAEITS